MSKSESSSTGGAVKQRQTRILDSAAWENKMLPFGFPKVSVILSNYNYGKFLEQAISSVIDQRYPSFECIIVDDCSTDKSFQVLDLLQSRYPDIVVIRRKINGGQFAAMLDGFAVSSGDYILFMDADDVLTDDNIANHIALHLASRKAVGFTCCNAFQIVNDRVVSAQNSNFGNALVELEYREGLLSTTALNKIDPNGNYLLQPVEQQVRYVDRFYPGWPWSTTSSMMFRKEAIDLIKDVDGYSELRICADNYLAHCVNLLAGSLLFDLPLVCYRLHASNGYNKRAPLDGFLAYDRERQFTGISMRIFLDDLLDRVEHFAYGFDDPQRLLAICRHIDGPDTEEGLPTWAAKSHFARLLVERQEIIAASVGKAPVLAWMRLLEVPKTEIRIFLSEADPLRVAPLIAVPKSKEKEGNSTGQVASLSKETVHAVAMEVWFERQRWGWPYKISKWLKTKSR